jgi:hypothetical protein
MNGNGMELYRINPETRKSFRIKTSHQVQTKILEPSDMIQELTKDYNDSPTFVTGFICVGMSVTLINETLGNFDNVVMAHHHYSRDKLYQLCRFLFNYTNWAPENKAKIKRTKFYSLKKSVVDTCLDYEANVERMSSEFAGKTCSLREIQGLEPEEQTEREIKKDALTAISVTNNPLWRKFKVYEGNDDSEWVKLEQFYQSIMEKPLGGRSKPKKIDGFYHCSTTGNVEKQSTIAINSMHKQRWDSCFQLKSDCLRYSRVFVGYDRLDDPTEYTIYIKYAILSDSEDTRTTLQRYGKSKQTVSENAS